MKKDFDFNSIGKRLPYSVPDGFFDKLDEEIMRKAMSVETAKPKPRRSIMRIFITAATAVAASMALFLVFNHSKVQQPSATDNFAEVEQAFARLSNVDKDYLLEVYQDDIFFNQ